MGGRGHGKGKGTKGTSKSQCSPEEIRHAAQLNSWRESEDLPRKSPGSVTRAKARSAAYHAAKVAAIDAQGIGPPAVKPPPPPPPPPRERRGERSEHAGVAVRLVERDETPLPSQPEASTVLIERGEVLPREGEESAAFQVHRAKRRVDDHLQGTASRQRGEFLPRYESDQKLVTGGELLPQDAKALETDSETEQEPQALSSQTSSATPWQRRVKKREERETSRGSEAGEPSRGSDEVLSQPAILHGMATIRGVPRDTLSSLPKELAYEWQEGPTGGLAGTRLVFLARGGDKMVFEAEEMILKLSLATQYWEVKFSQLLPKITARTHWQERVLVRLHQVNGEVLHSHNMFMSCQDKVLLASELLGARGASFAFHFLAYVGCLLTYVTSLKITAKDTGISNIGVRLSTASASCPEAVFFDTLSWRQGAKVSSKWVGWCDCARRFCPLQSSWLQEASATAASNPTATFARLLQECQAYSFRLSAQGVLVDGGLAKGVLPTSSER